MELANTYAQTPLYKEIAGKKNQFEPYVNNSGTVIGIGGPGFCVIAGDTRLSQGYSIVSRNTSKLNKLTDTTVLATSGMYADFTALSKTLKKNLQTYEFNIGRQASTKCVAQLLSYTLYMKRFFPFYTFNLLAGINEEGQGVIYGYDAIGSFEPKTYVAQGSGQSMVAGLLDGYIQGYNKINHQPPKTPEEVIDFVLDCFNSIAERDIYTGDSVEVVLMQVNQPLRSETFKLRKD